MRKIYLILLLVLLVGLIGCNENIKEVVALNISKVEMSNEKEEIIYTINIMNEQLITENNNIKQFNYYYSFEKKDKKELLKLEKNEIKNTELVHKIAFNETNYKSDFSIIFELELSKDGFIYTKVNEINISTLAKDEYLRNTENKIAENICNPNRLYTVDITIDIEGKKGNGEGDTYYYAYDNPSYQKVTLTITLKDEYFFADNFIFIFNGKTIESSKYTIDNNVLTYIFNDPNWSIIV